MPNPDKTPGQKLVQEWMTELDRNGIEWDDLGWLAQRVDRLIAELTPKRVLEALQPFARAFEKNGKFIFDACSYDPVLVEINDENQIVPSGTTMGDYRRAYEALAAIRQQLPDVEVKT